jgi:glucokinase
VAVGVDVGGSKILGLVVDPAGEVLARALRATPGSSSPDGGEALGKAIAEVLNDLDGQLSSTAAVGVGLPGLVIGRRRLVYAPHLRSAQGADLASLLAPVLRGRTLVVANDADLAALAEHRAGAACGHSDALVLTLGTGIGSGLIVDGELRVGSGFAGEVGHMVVDVDGPRCPCGARGCWERFASGSGLGRLAREAAMAGRLVSLVDGLGGDPELVRGEDVTTAAAAGDPEACSLLDELGWWLASGIANLVCVLDPSVVVVGGGLAGVTPLFLPAAERHLATLLEASALRPAIELRSAAFGAEAGAVGASIFAREVA